MTTIKKPGLFQNLWVLAALSLCLGACAKSEESKSLAELIPAPAEPPVTNVQPAAPVVSAKYVYPFSSRRDPFSPMDGTINYADSGVSSLARGETTNLELKGILQDRKGKMAIITSSDGEPFVLRSGRVYDRKNRIIPGIAGIIKENSVILISQNRTVTQLNLRKNNDGSIVVR